MDVAGGPKRGRRRFQQKADGGETRRGSGRSRSIRSTRRPRRAHWGQNPRAKADGGSPCSLVVDPIPALASQNPNAWLKQPLQHPTRSRRRRRNNRLIAWPLHPKLMVANPDPSTWGAAVLMTSLAKSAGPRAHSTGSPESTSWGGASAEEPRDYLVRDQFFREPSAECRASKAVMDLARRRRPRPFDAIELYSCFPPGVPKNGAADARPRRRTCQPTVTGGG